MSLTLLCICGVLWTCSSSSASSLVTYYHGRGQENCWQTGVWYGENGEACDLVGAGFLPTPGPYEGLAHIYNATPGGEEQLPSGDYCNPYGIGEGLKLQDSTNEGQWTGWTPPSPYSSYQESNYADTACQAEGGTWGQKLTPGSGSSCYARVCGMHHQVSFHNQGYNNMPWDSRMVNPKLVMFTSAGPGAYSHGSGTDAGGWGYVCLIFQEIHTGAMIELCLEEWRATTNEAAWKSERIGECSEEPVANVTKDEAISYFWPGTSFNTLGATSSTTYEYSGSSSEIQKFYETEITKEDFEHVLQYDEREYHEKPGHPGQPEVGNGCVAPGHGRFSSTKASEFALIGASQGMEMWREAKVLAGRDSGLYLYDEYALNPPGATTNEASYSEYTAAAINGAVTSNGEYTQYHFDYGTSEAYGKSTPTYYSGAGKSFTPKEEHETLTGLAPSTTYYYRICATNQYGTTCGQARQFTTETVPSVITEPATKITETTAAVYGSVEAPGRYVLYWFEWGTSTGYGHHTTEGSLEPKGRQQEGTELTGLTPGAIYHYRFVAEVGGVGGEYYYGLDNTFTTWDQHCGGTAIMAMGDSALAPAQELWGIDFNTSTAEVACSGAQGAGGKPVVSYAAKETGNALEALGAEHSEMRLSEWPFVVTGEAPSKAQQAEIEAHGIPSSESGVETMPLVQESAAVLIHLPEGCLSSSEARSLGGKLYKFGRLVLDGSTLAKIYEGSITTWKQLIEHQASEHGEDRLHCEQASEEESPIKPIVPRGRDGMTHIVKDYLQQVATGTFTAEAYPEVVDGERTGCTHSYGEEAGVGWKEVSEGCENERWPLAAHVTRAGEPGDQGVVSEVAHIAGSIGYASLAIARTDGRFSKKGIGGENKKGTEFGQGEEKSQFWAEIQDSEPGKVPVEYADPASNEDIEKAASANCSNTRYLNVPGEPDPPVNALASWAGVKAEATQPKYSLCGLLYAVALRRYSFFTGMANGAETTAHDFLVFALNKTTAGGGGSLIKNHDYELTSGTMHKEAESGAKEIEY
ncbi:MAG: hypothetical protein ACRDLF_00530 [Solirubrobacteraceae bacterium]